MIMSFKAWLFELELIELALVPSQWWEILDQRIGSVNVYKGNQIITVL